MRKKLAENLVNPEDFSIGKQYFPTYLASPLSWLETILGRQKLYLNYRDYRTKNPNPEEFWQDAFSMLNIDINHINPAEQKIPATGPLLVIANHTYGALDGFVLSNLVSRVRKDIKIMINEIFYSVPEIRQFMLPIKPMSSKANIKHNIAMKEETKKHLQAGGAIIIFPAGAIGKSPRVWDEAIDESWKTYTARLAILDHVNILPFYFPGRNSLLYQIVNLFHIELSHIFLYHDMTSRMGKGNVEIVQRPIITAKNLAKDSKKTDILQQLRQAVYAEKFEQMDSKIIEKRSIFYAIPGIKKFPNSK